MVPQLKYFLLVLFLMGILKFQLKAHAVPKRRDVRDRRCIDGERLFQEAKCAVCHTSVFKTAEKLRNFYNWQTRLFTLILIFCYTIWERDWPTTDQLFKLVAEIGEHRFCGEEGYPRNYQGVS